MYFSKIRKYDISNGKGIGCTIFFSGCKCKCEGCHQPETWDFKYGYEFTKEIEKEFISYCKNPIIDHISLLGGDFMQQNYQEALEFIIKLKKETQKPIWVWTGLLYEELNEKQIEILNYVDVLIDGRFVKKLKDLNLKWRGSSNQRVIDVRKTLKNGEVTLYEL